MNGQEGNLGTHLFQMSIDNIPGLHFVLGCVSVSWVDVKDVGRLTSKGVSCGWSLTPS